VEIGLEYNVSDRQTPLVLRAIRRVVFLAAFFLSFSVLCEGANTVSLSTYNITISGSNPNYSVNVGDGRTRTWDTRKQC
jgi:hypothetical protein